MLGTQGEVPGENARRGGCNPRLDSAFVGRDLYQLPPANVEKNQAWVGATWQQASPRGQAVEPQLHRVRLDQSVVESCVGLVVDKRRPAFDLAHAIDKAAHPRLAEPQVELELDAERWRGGQRVL